MPPVLSKPVGDKTLKLSWDAPKVELLFHFCLKHGNHLSTSTPRWTKCQDDFFKQPCMLPFVAEYKPKVSETCNKEQSIRKLKDKFKQVIKLVKHDVEHGGNQSGKEGERSELYKTVGLMVEQLDRQAADKADDAELKARLDVTESDLFNEEEGVGDEGEEEGLGTGEGVAPDKFKKPKEGTGKRKLLNGQIMGNPLKSQRAPNSSFEEKLMAQLFDKKQKGSVEETAEKKIMMHTEEYLLTVRDLVGKCYSSASSDRHHALQVSEVVLLEAEVHSALARAEGGDQAVPSLLHLQRLVRRLDHCHQVLRHQQARHLSKSRLLLLVFLEVDRHQQDPQLLLGVARLHLVVRADGLVTLAVVEHASNLLQPQRRVGRGQCHNISVNCKVSEDSKS
jgi:hypothetical protein